MSVCVKVELPGAAFRAESVELACVFLSALGERDVTMVTECDSVHTGADLALQILQRRNAAGERVVRA